MRSWKIWTPVLIAVIGAAGFFFSRMGPPVVEIAEVKRGSVIDAVYATGEVEAVRRAEVAAEVPGRVAAVEVDAGDTVGEGALLAVIESTRFEASKAMAEQALNRAKSSWEESKKELDRREKLFRSRVVTEAEYESFKRNEERARAEYNRQKAALEIEEDRAVKARISSPIAGLVVSRGVEPGEYAAAGRPLFRVIDPGSLMVVVDVDETEVAKIMPGQAVRVSLDAYPGETYKCEVERVIPRIDEITKTAEVRMNFIERPEALQEGMSATVNIIAREVEGSLLIPRQAVTLEKEKAWVYAVSPEDKLLRIEFTPGAMDENKVEVRDGEIEEGMKIVLEPGADLEAGMAVKVKNHSRDSGAGL
jgi:RND family efflux transporter MFP subunit